MKYSANKQIANRDIGAFQVRCELKSDFMSIFKGKKAPK